MPSKVAGRPVGYRPRYLAPGVSDERLDELKEIAGDGTLDERCRRLLPVVHAHFDHRLGPPEYLSQAELTRRRRERRMEALAKRQAILDHIEWMESRGRKVRVA